MQAGFGASAYGHSGRHLRFVAIVAMLFLIDVWLWGRLAFGIVSERPGPTGETLIAVAAATASLLAIVAIWRTPLRPTITAAATPSRRHSLATHHSGHIVAMHLLDPDRIERTRLFDPCHLSTGSQIAASQTALRHRLTIILSGLTAEEVFAGESGSHTAGDLAIATRVGADMVGRYGMTGSLVSLATGRRSHNRFIDRVLDDARSRKELEALLRDSKRDSMRLMLENRHLIIAVRDALVRNNTLSPDDIRRVIDEADKRRHSDDEVLVDIRAAGERNRPLIRASEL